MTQPPSGYPYGPPPPPRPIPPKHPDAVTVLVLGVIAVAAFPLTGPFAWAIGARARREFDDNPGRWSGEDELKVGYVLGIVGTVLLLLGVLAIAFLILTFTAFARS
jgi:hypothetical protein